MTAPVLGAVPAFDEASGHLYDAVEAGVGGINWTDARTAAEGMSSGSCQGYLASVTSAEENDFILSNFQGGVPSIGGTGYWIGGFQTAETGAPADGWGWVSGEPWGYTDWATGKPDGLLTVDAVRYVGTTGFTPIVQWEDIDLTLTAPGYIVEFVGDCTEDALIDVMLKLTQGEGPRNINLKSQGKIAAAVLSIADVFDATTIDPTTVTLGDGSDPDAPVAGNKHGKLMVAWPDLDGDGLADALFHFNTQDLVAAGLTAETTELVLHGMTTDGVEFSGVDDVAVK